VIKTKGTKNAKQHYEGKEKENVRPATNEFLFLILTSYKQVVQ